MKIKILIASILYICSTALFADVIDEIEIGIGEDNVFSDATPTAFAYSDAKAGKSELLPIAYSTLPPQISHSISDYLPITIEENECTECHDRQKKIGKTERRTGKKIPMPLSHYGGFKGEGDEEEVSGARYMCTQCHVPQSGAMPLVENTYSQ